MRGRDTFDALCSVLAVVADATAVLLGFLLAVWIRFDSGWVPLFHEAPPPRDMYLYGAAVATLLFLLIFRTLNLYVRPQYGHFVERIPRIVRAIGLGLLLSTALAFAVRTNQPFSRVATALAFVTVTFLVLIERNVLFQLERHWAKHQASKKAAVIVGTDALALQLRDGLVSEPRLRTTVAGFVSAADMERDAALGADEILCLVNELPALLADGRCEEVFVSDPSALDRETLANLIIQCERSLCTFHMVPDLFQVMTSSVQVQNVGGIPLLGVDSWPLDHFLNRLVKRMEDITGALVGLLCSAPIIAVAAVLIRRESRGSIFFCQERCGEGGQVFMLYKLRTMCEDAEASSGPVWTSPEDPRCTRVGAVLRKYNIDELPQFWNVLIGNMSLVGPRPERPHFVHQFKDELRRYMVRHVSRPGMTGWAQVNGLRGQTSLEDRIKYDLYYLENWSLSFDFKILAKTFNARKNAY